MPEPVHLGGDGSKHRVVRVACVAGLIAWHPVVLEVGRRNVGLIVNFQTSSVGFHDVAGEAELRLLGALNVVVKTQQAGEDRGNEQSKKKPGSSRRVRP